MASHLPLVSLTHHHHQAPPPPPTITATTQCCCYHNPPNTCCTTPPPQHHLLHPVASLLSQPQPHPILPSQQNYTKSHIHHNLNLPTQNHHLQHQHQTHSAISSLLHRIESLESSLNHYTRHSLRHTAATVIQTHFRSFLVRRSRTLTQLKHLAQSSIFHIKRFSTPLMSSRVVILVMRLKDDWFGCGSCNVSGAVEDDGVNSYQGADEEEEVLVLESGEEMRRKEQLHAHQEKLLFSAPLPLKMENRNGVKKSKGVKILT
ncbi:BAG family molecular chaperone regulator 8, chloroplastic [Vigna umbellata]|uniref:BAG family molecular chaperone regulator 8, chloroplastic n=1 Tax=Vigna umbellata TaxID=87088 RepID=UPI001F5F274E|nr:BAG family molecular chaperone regulator 8, chloroplastic [Vigna umbellata]